MNKTYNSDCSNPQAKITLTIVTAKERQNFLFEHFGPLFVSFESEVYRWLDYLSKNYRGGYWQFYRLSNGGLYMAPKTDKTFRMENPGNYFDGELSADAAGIAVCCYALSSLAFEHPTKTILSKYFHLLREFALDHIEAGPIFRLID